MANRAGRNPPLATFGNPPPVISKEVTRIEYVHSGNGKRYFHDFKPPVRMRVVNGRTVELFHPTRDIVVDLDV